MTESTARAESAGSTALSFSHRRPSVKRGRGRVSVEHRRGESDGAPVTGGIDRAHAEIDVVAGEVRQMNAGHVPNLNHIGPIGIAGLAPDHLVSGEIRFV